MAEEYTNAQLVEFGIARPTGQLRFVECHIDIAGTIRPVRILQQQWSYEWGPLEWRDVPLEREE